MAGAVSPFYMGGLSSFVADEILDERRAFAYDALSYNLSAAAAVLGALSAAAIRLPSHAGEGGSVWRTVAAGLRQILGHRPLAVVAASSTLSQLGQGGLAVVAIALSTERIGSPSEGAILVTAFAVGSLLGALYETARPTLARPHAVMMVRFLATGLLTVVAALDLGTIWTVVAIGLSGVFTASTAATGLSGGVSVAGIGLVWVASAALMGAYPKTTQDGTL